MKAIVHIGFPKTGTSSIQTWLGQNAPALQRQGVLYDRGLHLPGAKRNPSQVELVFACQEELGREADYKRLRRQLSIHTRKDQTARVRDVKAGLEKVMRQNPDARLMVLSSENISSLVVTPEEIAALDGWLSRLFDQITYVAYLRRQEDYLASRYCQALRSGVKVSLRRFLKRHQLLDYHAFAQVWRGVVGDRLSLRLFEPDQMPNGDVITDFAQVIGVEAQGMIRPERQNESFSFAGAALVRAINKQVPLFTSASAKTRNPLLLEFQEAIAACERNPRKFRLSAEETERVRSLNADGNEQLRQLCFPDLAELFPARPDADQGPPKAQHSEVANLAVRVMLHMQQSGRTSPLDTSKLLMGLGKPSHEHMSAKD